MYIRTFYTCPVLCPHAFCATEHLITDEVHHDSSLFSSVLFVLLNPILYPGIICKLCVSVAVFSVRCQKVGRIIISVGI